MVVEFRLLGPLEVIFSGEPVELGGPKQRRVLAALALRPGRVVAVEQLVDAVWDGEPPATARRQIQNAVSALRQGPLGAVLAAHGPGYLLRVGSEQIDASRFDQHITRACAARAARDLAGALRELQAALSLWRGPALAGVGGLVGTTAAAGLEERRLAALEIWAETALDLGQHDAVAAELRQEIEQQPLRERLAEHYLLALYRCGQAAESLRCYHRVRQALAEELGVDPGRALSGLYKRILMNDPTLKFRPAVRGVATPRELPRDVAQFTGRTDALTQLDGWLAEHVERTSGPMVISAIAGIGGVGKTALAVHWAHRVVERFPDGQLYVNLRGYDRQEPMTPVQALTLLLRSLGRPAETIPADQDAASALYRSMLADRRVLIVLDNAATVEQVRPLLPGGAGSVVVVTSRDQLAGLVARDGARRLAIDVLPPAEAVDLLRAILGRDRIDAEPEAAATLALRCSYLPLALRIAVANLALQDGIAIADYVALLSTDRLSRLEIAADSESSVRTIFARSYRSLPVAAGRLFRLLGLLPAGEVSPTAAAALADLDAAQAAALIGCLLDASLVAESRPDRFSMHDVLRDYATELVETLDNENDTKAALHRWLDFYLHTANTAAHLLQPHRAPSIPDPAPAAVRQELTDRDSAIAWFAAEHPILVAAIGHTVRHKLDAYTVRLCSAVAEHLDWSGHWTDFVSTQLALIAAANRLDDAAAMARSHRGLGYVLPKLGRYDEANSHLNHALDLYHRLGDQPAIAHTHLNIASVFEQRHNYEQARRHAVMAANLSHTVGDLRTEAIALNNVGWFHAQLGAYGKALAACERALAVLERTDDPWPTAGTWDSLGYIHHHREDYGQAVASYRRAIELFREIGNRFGEADSLTHLGESHLAAGDIAAARAAWHHSLQIYRELEHPNAEDLQTKIMNLDFGPRITESG